jgi:hypothetical protein
VTISSVPSSSNPTNIKDFVLADRMLVLETSDHSVTLGDPITGKILLEITGTLKVQRADESIKMSEPLFICLRALSDSAIPLQSGFAPKNIAEGLRKAAEQIELLPPCKQRTE